MCVLKGLNAVFKKPHATNYIATIWLHSNVALTDSQRSNTTKLPHTDSVTDAACGSDSVYALLSISLPHAFFA